MPSDEAKNRKIAKATTFDEDWCWIVYDVDPVNLADPRYTLLLIEWAAKQDWWIAKATGDYLGGIGTWGDWVQDTVGGCGIGDASASTTATRIRDLIFDAIKENE